ncbi:unnamed protein product [Somion occarium]|uniref:Uncharacterized protein n=1 Tax=Somion occarium TaxID=3059160 RepID=A0ABP1CJV1_9APHY
MSATISTLQISPNNNLSVPIKASDLRLPSYHCSYLNRFHPYARASPRPQDLMKTVDRPFADYQDGRPSFALSVVSEEDENAVNAFAEVPIAPEVQLVIAATRPGPLKGIRLLEAVIDFALMMRRRLRSNAKDSFQ